MAVVRAEVFVKETGTSGNAAGCYGLLLLTALTVAILALFGASAPEKNDLDIEISAEP